MGADEPEQPLTIAPEALGKLVHELLRRAVDALEPSPGFVAASTEQIEAAVQAAADDRSGDNGRSNSRCRRGSYGRTRCGTAREIAITALKFGETRESDTQSWTEVPFGGLIRARCGTAAAVGPGACGGRSRGRAIRIQGTIDRLDLRRAKQAVRVTDYKTGACPPKAEHIVIRGGAELQRSLYALACRQLLPDCAQRRGAASVSRRTSRAKSGSQDLDAALRQISEFVALACEFLTRGAALPGQDADAAAQ